MVDHRLPSTFLNMTQQPQITTQDLFAVIGEKEVQLAIARVSLAQLAETVKQLHARIAELEGTTAE